MGEVVRATCAGCGFVEKTEIGGGLFNSETHSYFPYLCDACGMVSVNIAQEPIVCPSDPTHRVIRYGSSNQERMAMERAEWKPEIPKPTFLERIGLKRQKLPTMPSIESERPICQWGDHEILAGSYECPSCHELSLNFTATGEFFD